MTAPEKAIESRGVHLTVEEIAKIKSICEQTLLAQPQLRFWVRSIPVAPDIDLPFLPIRCFRLTKVSRFKTTDELPQRKWAAEFFSSGSTHALRAQHLMSEGGLDAYRQSAIEGWQYACKRLSIPAKTPVVSLVPSAEANPNSSLSMMLSFWRDNEIPVHFIDIDEDQGSLENCMRELQSLGNQLREFVLFGTSLHHLQFLQWHRYSKKSQPFIHALRVWCFDTGGTKGRTQSTNQGELHEGIQRYFFPGCTVHFLSEYGMCELSSQAYSLHYPHGDTFKCSPKLRAFAISPHLDRISTDEKMGFLGFIDLANTDSWPCIVSEDLGRTLTECRGSFQLLGRSPDATPKGCSLNVRSSYRFDLENLPPETQSQAGTSSTKQTNEVVAQRPPVPAQMLLNQLSQTEWPECALRDLRLSLADWDTSQHDTTFFPAKLLGESIAIVTSANIPITWLFPALHAWHMHAGRVVLYLPSLRPDDPMTALIRRQIISLANAFNQIIQKDFIRIHNHRLLAHASDTPSDRILVFGSNDTLATLSNALARLKQRPHLVPLGHFQNAMRLKESDRAEEIAELCTLWMGRGCLTPLQLEVPDTWERNKIETFVTDFFSAMKSRRQEWLDNLLQCCGLNLSQVFSHQHNLAELQAIASSQKVEFNLLHCCETGSVIVDVTQCPTLDEKLKSKLSDFAGGGWVNLVTAEHALAHSYHNPVPKLCEPHQGFLWRDWFFKTMPIAESTILT